MVLKTDMRYAHNDGLISLFSDRVTGKILTCGSDGDARIWTDFETDDPVSFRVAESASAICSNDTKMYVADECGSIYAFILPDGTKEGLISKFSLPVNHMDISMDGQLLAAVSSDFALKLINLADNNEQTAFGIEEPATHPFLSVCIDPQGEFIATSCCDGCVKIWRILEPSKAMHTIKILPRFNDMSKSRPLARLHFQPDSGKLLAVPSGRSVLLYDRSNWKQCEKIDLEDNDEELSVCRFSDCGKYLAAGSMKGRVIVWDVNTTELIIDEIHPKNRCICALIWHPVYKNRLIYGDTEGSVGVLKDVLPENFSDHKKRRRERKSSLENDDRQSASGFLDDKCDEDDDVSCDSNIGALKAHYTSKIYGSDYDEDDQEVSNQKSNRKEIAGDMTSSMIPLREPSWKPKPYQKPFVVNSTPENLGERFMKWNTYGVIRQYNTEEECSIDIEFHDVTLHHAIQINNYAPRYIMADLNDQIVALVSSPANDKSGRLHVIHFGAWDLSKEWSVNMPEGEEPVGIAVGARALALCSDRRNVWLFSLAGLQIGAFVLPGPIVTIAAGDRTVAVVYNDGLDNNGYPLFFGSLIHCSTDSYKDLQTQFSSFRLPVTPGCSLVWLGFSSEESLCFCDSSGSLLMGKHGTWMRIFNAESPNGDFFWAIAVQEHSHQVQGIRVCKSVNKYPSMLPRPVVSLTDWNLNLCDPGTEKCTIESGFMLARIRNESLMTNPTNESSYEFPEAEKAELQAILKLFLLACNAERDCRAYEIALLANKSSTLSALLNIANKKGRLVLANKIEMLASAKLRQEQEKRQKAEHSQTFDRFSTENAVVTQPLFDSPEVSAKHASPDEAHADSDLSFMETNNQDRQKFMPLTTSGILSNPFKKTSTFNEELPENGSSFQTKSVFDDIGTYSKRKSYALAQDAAEVLSGNADSAKKPRMITLKKQAKLTFGSRTNASMDD